MTDWSSLSTITDCFAIDYLLSSTDLSSNKRDTERTPNKLFRAEVTAPSETLELGYFQQFGDQRIHLIGSQLLEQNQNSSRFFSDAYYVVNQKNEELGDKRLKIPVLETRIT